MIKATKKSLKVRQIILLALQIALSQVGISATRKMHTVISTQAPSSALVGMLSATPKSD
jgi:hypothetical protein